jgi:hypothetical protein
MEKFINLNNDKKEIYFLGFNFKYIEFLFGLATTIAVVPQIYKIHTSKMAKDFNMIFIWGMVFVNTLFFMVGFINNIAGLMLGSVFFIFKNLAVVYYYHYGLQYTLKQI